VFLLPAAVLIGLTTAAVLWAVGQLSRRGSRWLPRLLPLAWAAGLFAYGATSLVAAKGSLGFGPALALAAGAAVVGQLTYAALEAIVGRTIRARRTKPIAAMLLAAAALWVGSLVWTLKPEGREEFPAALPSSPAGRPNVLLVILDAVRPDHMSCYGYGRKTTPHIDAFASEARRYTTAVSPGAWTLPSHASIFTGLPVGAHGCTWAHPYLDVQFDTLAEKLRSAGYQTVGLSSNAVLGPSRLVGQGFETYWTPAVGGRPDPVRHTLAARLAQELSLDTPAALSEQMHEQLARWFGRQYKADRPFFVFLNYLDAHQPFAPVSRRLTWASEAIAAKWRKRDQRVLLHRYKFAPGLLSPDDIGELTALYDEEIAYVDSKVGELLAWLKRVGLFDNTLIIMTADHGEQLGEHGMMEHQYSLYEAVLRVPLIVRFRDLFPTGVDDALVQTHDVYPTVLEIVGVEWTRTAAYNCQSLLSAGRMPGRLAVSEYLAPWLGGLDPGTEYPATDPSRFLQPLRAVRSGSMKLIRWSGGATELYDLASDPLETEDLSRARPAEAARLKQMLEEWLASFEHYTPRPRPFRQMPRPSKEELEALKELGYVR